MFKSKLGASQTHVPCSRPERWSIGGGGLGGLDLTENSGQPPELGQSAELTAATQMRRKPLCPALEIPRFPNCNFSGTLGPEGATQPPSKPLLTVDQAT